MLKDTRTNSYNLARTLVLVLTSQMEMHELTKKINRSLLEKAQCLLSNARLDKSFWAEACMLAIS